MRSAVDFLPSSITLLMTCWTRRERYMESGSIGRTWAAARRGISRSSGLDAVHGAALLAATHASGVERPAHDLVAHARQVLDAAASHEHDRVLLEVVALARDVRGDLHPVREPHARDLAERRVRLLRRDREDARADAAALRRGEPLLAALTGLEAGRRHLLLRPVAPLADELVDARHAAGDASRGAAAGRGQGPGAKRRGGAGLGRLRSGAQRRRREGGGR